MSSYEKAIISDRHKSRPGEHNPLDLLVIDVLFSLFGLCHGQGNHCFTKPRRSQMQLYIHSLPAGGQRIQNRNGFDFQTAAFSVPLVQITDSVPGHRAHQRPRCTNPTNRCV